MITNEIKLEAEKIWNEHSGGTVFMAGPDSLTGPGYLSIIMQLLSFLKFDWKSISLLAIKLVPLIVAKDWDGVKKAIIDFFLNPITPPNNGPSLPE